MRFINLTIGVLGIHGSVEEHLNSLEKLKVKSLKVKTIEDLNKIDGLIMPGGESTTIGMLMKLYSLDKILKEKIKKGFPVYGTCAGAILLAKKIVGSQKAKSLQVMNIEIERNAFGRQVESFEVAVSGERLAVSQKNIPAVFIRAPRIKRIGKNVKILAEYEGEPILVQEENMLAGTFHPELTSDLTVHRYFVELCKKYKTK